jgi:hypothetical protein
MGISSEGSRVDIAVYQVNLGLAMRRVYELEWEEGAHPLLDGTSA